MHLHGECWGNTGDIWILSATEGKWTVVGMADEAYKPNGSAKLILNLSHDLMIFSSGYESGFNEF